MSSYRLVAPASLQIFPTEPPFSNFDFVDREFGERETASIRRLFSQARSYGCQTLVIEAIPATSVLQDDDTELVALFPDYHPGGLRRLTFWKQAFRKRTELHRQSSSSLLGFALLKRDVVPSRNTGRWYVFESVLKKYPHRHNCVRGANRFRLRAGDAEFCLSGVPFCQQNGLNKACAQVALRSLCIARNPEVELSYATINRLAGLDAPGSTPWNGLDVQQIQAVLRGLSIGFYDIDYTRKSAEERVQLLYRKLIYAGIESGAGALLGFSLSGPALQEQSHHIIPFFGHTFNQDTWVPNAEVEYFQLGEQTRYLPSEAWASSFIGHDDNFGSNFCVPRYYITPEQVAYALELLPSGCAYSGSLAEAVAVDYLYSIMPETARESSPWLKRLQRYVGSQQVVLRAIFLTKREYIEHWRSLRDWENRAETETLCSLFGRYLPAYLWMVEVSVPELYPANLRKVGEIVLMATQSPTAERDFASFLHARVPGAILVLKSVSKSGEPTFTRIPSKLLSHTALFGCEGGSAAF